MPEQTCAVILAGGEGKRMKSNHPKVLASVLFKPMLQWVMDAAEGAGVKELCVVTGHKHEQVEAYLQAAQKPGGANLHHVLQAEQRGTGHAVMMAEPFLRAHNGGNTLVLNGDAPFVSAEVLKTALAAHVGQGNAVTVISAELDDPSGYGRIVRDPATGLVRAIVEQKDADEATLAVREINSGAYWFRTDDLLSILGCIRNDNAQGEYYLTDAVRLLIEQNKNAGAYIASDPAAVMGANDCVQLNSLNEIARERVLHAQMLAGVEIPCTDGVLIGPDVTIGLSTRILPNTILRGNTAVGADCSIGPSVVLTDCTVGDGASLCFASCEHTNISSSQAVAPFTVIGTP